MTGNRSRPGTEGWAQDSEGGEEGGACSGRFELGWKPEWGCGAVRLCTLLAGWHGDAEIVGDSLEMLPRRDFGSRVSTTHWGSRESEEGACGARFPREGGQEGGATTSLAAKYALSRGSKLVPRLPAFSPYLPSRRLYMTSTFSLPSRPVTFEDPL